MAHLQGTRTGRMRRHHLTGLQLPVVSLSRAEEVYPVEVEGELFYLVEEAGEWLLFREAAAVDAGGNIIRRRRPTQTTFGLCQPVQSGDPPLTRVGLDPAYFVEFAYESVAAS